MNILLTAPYNEEAREVLSKFGNVVYKPWKPHGRAYHANELIQLLKEANADALITEHDHVTKEVLSNVPLQFVGVCRGTPSNVDVKYATKKGIPVFNTPARNAQAVAEMFIGNLITFMRNTFYGHKWLKEKKWDADAHTAYLQFKGNEIAGKTVGMVGFGAVGQCIAGILRHFPCDIQFYDPFIESPDPDYKKVTLEEVFSTSEIVSIHLPVNEHTKGMINKELMNRMKKDAIFINTARAVVVDREALIEVLKENKIRGAILDVFYHEPPDEVDYEIINHPNVLATPHIAGATYEVEDHHAVIMNENLRKWFIDKNRDFKEFVNKEVLQVLEV
ncbi:2-hydroxyacid dehydrogenase [Paenactinomyces guangxiensis]|uniref:2-hydroxyacid dehydrogenase n=1 Tax=Paenactinomyces guangxiensis TaxID=1490290 RepID=A0A7W2A875_9BACL|nr:2-hydroxyacid dehydrogenase [Paenactinomyces guangxiensis]MBA4493518.1 2-hydroxyacid dehydrogenase [Paenactinomyces guangxiensis]MBH8590609.1 2-hydroxyacid dehydrogenase [Paenactinomyces guangxiensis]